MSPPERSAWLLIACALFATSAHAQTQEERRRALQDRLGIKPRPDAPDAGVPPTATAPQTPPAGETPQTPVATPTTPTTPSAPGTAPRPAAPRGPTFATLRPMLDRECQSCHSPDGKAKKSKWVLTGGPEDYDNTLRFVKKDAPEQSSLLRKGTGATLHGGKKTIAADSAEAGQILEWIRAGAPRGALGSAPATPAPVAAAPSAPATTPGATSAPSTPAPTAPGAASPPTTATPGATAAVPPATEAPAATPTAQTGLLFAPQVHAALVEGCASCHSADGMAASTRYLASEDPAAHLAAAAALVTPGNSAGSTLFQRARGENHEPGAVWEPGSAELTLLAQWIDGGALGAAPAAGAPVATAPAGPAAPAPAPTAAAPQGGPPGVSLGTYPVLGSLRLNGRFDLNYERVGYNDHPFQSAGDNALRSYHQFLFLTRQSTSDPVTISLEALSLQFWEVGIRFSPESWPVKAQLKLGKILVPFGSEPLFHHSYGGHAGFDNRVLPVVFAREGLSVNVQRQQGAFRFSADAYLIAGYGLRRPDSVLNLQADFAPLEETKIGFGARLGAAWGPISLWYSPYYNALGAGRGLFMQALDLTVWRPRGIFIAERFSLGAGLLRADVAGGGDQGYGGRGEDYFHFASYFQLRYYAQDWLYVQYRQGLRTFNNRRGLFLDPTDLTRDDGSTHNIGVMARWQGLSLGLFHYWNLEKADEVPDDFTRLVVAYEF